MTEMSDDEHRVNKVIREYSERYCLGYSLSMSKPYHLQNDWSEEFPDARSCGCYLFFDSDRNLLYVGKVSLNHSLGRRLASYFQKGTVGGVAVAHHIWSATPTYLRTIAVKEPHEAPSLEEYLLLKLAPSNNSQIGRAP